VIWIDREREETQIGRENDATRQREEGRGGGRERARERAIERAKTGGESRQKTQWAMAGPVGP
jgi:hypothetical protein